MLGTPAADELSTAFLIMTIVAVPILSGLVVRDGGLRVLLRRAIAERIKRVRCLECRYVLLGQTVTNGSVRCPECGATVTLKRLGLESANELLPPVAGDDDPRPDASRSA